MQRRLERFLPNGRIDWQRCCQAWSRWVLSRYEGKRLIRLVDETKVGTRLSVMVVGLADRGCCIPLAFWCYAPKQWSLKQVELIETLLAWVAPSIPAWIIPLVQADRGSGTSPDLLRLIQQLGWYFQVRLQKNSRLRRADHPDCPLAALVSRAGQTWQGKGKVFKKAGWLDAGVLILWGQAYVECWCLVTNGPWVTGWDYALRYWQEGAFPDLKSDGWQWQLSRIWTPAYANRLLLVLTLAYAWVLSLGTLLYPDPQLARRLSKGKRRPYSLFRLGLRLWDALGGLVYALLAHHNPLYLAFSSPFHPSIESVGA